MFFPEINQPKPITEYAKTLYDYLGVKDNPAKADVIYIAGGPTEGPINKGAELWKQVYAPKIAFISTGGRVGGEKVWGEPEQTHYHRLLGQLGVPDEAMIWDGLTDNTLKEAKQLVPFLQSKGVEARTIILVGKPYHQRRISSSFVQQNPDVKFINCPADEHLNFNDREDLKKMIDELERILRYSKKGDIQMPELTREQLVSAMMIRRYLRKTESAKIGL